MADRISSTIEDVIFYIHPKGKKQVYYNRRTHGKKRNINEIFAYGGRRYPHPFSYSSAHSKQMPFNKMLKPVHKIKLHKLQTKVAVKLLIDFQ